MRFAAPDGQITGEINFPGMPLLPEGRHVDMSQNGITIPNAQLNTSFPIIIRYLSHIEHADVPSNCESSSAFDAGTMFSGRHWIVGKVFVPSLVRSSESVVVSGGSGA